MDDGAESGHLRFYGGPFAMATKPGLRWPAGIDLDGEKTGWDRGKISFSLHPSGRHQRFHVLFHYLAPYKRRFVLASGAKAPDVDVEEMIWAG